MGGYACVMGIGIVMEGGEVQWVRIMEGWHDGGAGCRQWGLWHRVSWLWRPKHYGKQTYREGNGFMGMVRFGERKGDKKKKWVWWVTMDMKKWIEMAMHGHAKVVGVGMRVVLQWVWVFGGRWAWHDVSCMEWFHMEPRHGRKWTLIEGLEVGSGRSLHGTGDERHEEMGMRWGWVACMGGEIWV